MSMTSQNIGNVAAEKVTENIQAAKNVNKPVPPSAEQIKQAAQQLEALTPKEQPEQVIPQEHIDSGFRLNVAAAKEAQPLVDAIPDLNKLDPYASAQQEFDDEIAREEAQAAEVLAEANKTQLKVSGKAIQDLIEDDAYDLEVPLYAGVQFNPNLLKVDLKDPNYIARWGNRNTIRQSMLAAQGFKFVRLDEVRNIDHLSMFEDSMGHIVWADLVAMKISKNVYYAGLRRAYMKSLHATNDKKSRESGAAFAAQELNRALTGPERSYMSNHKQQTHKEIYTPVAGV